jgi:pimeloyl-ACP methyl ester carboxylesterase
MNRILAFAFVCLLIACNPTSQNKYEFLNKDAAFRTEISTRTGGSFVELSEGYTYFQEANKNSQQSTVILVHGFSVPSYIWETTYEALIEKGFHVVVLDLYGRGFSDNPDTDYTDRLMANQVLELLNHLNITKAHLVGLSNGGRIISQAAVLQPQLVQSLIYVSSNSFEDIEITTDISVSTDEIAEFISRYPAIALGQLNDFFDPTQFPNWPEKYTALQQYKGFAQALISTRKNHTTMDVIHQKINDLNLPVYTIWGVADQVVVYADFKDKLQRLLPNRKEFFIAQSAHLPQIENESAFEELLITEILVQDEVQVIVE